MKIIWISLLLILCLQITAHTEVIWFDRVINTNNKHYLRAEWERLLGFDLFWVYFKVRDKEDTIYEYLKIEKFSWDCSLKIKEDRINIKFEREF